MVREVRPIKNGRSGKTGGRWSGANNGDGYEKTRAGGFRGTQG